MPKVHVVVPGDVPEWTDLKEKDGTVVRQNTRQLYVEGYVQGWEDFWRQYRMNSRVLDDPNAEPIVPQEFSVQTQGRFDGFNACRVELKHK